MPQWAGSCWYYLRFLDPKNDQALVDPEIEKAWMPVDLYVGGAEHAVLHLLYARFWHKVLFDRGYVSTAEPFQKLVNQGMILGEMEFTGYQTPTGRWISAATCETPTADRVKDRRAGQAGQARADEVEKQGDAFVLKADPAVESTAGPTRCRRAAATWSIPTRWSPNTGPTRCGSTRCSWARWRPSSRGAWTASAACAASSTACGG